MIHVGDRDIGRRRSGWSNKNFVYVILNVLNNRCEVGARAIVLHDHHFAGGRVHDEQIIHAVAGEIRRADDAARRGEICKVARDKAATRTRRRTVAAVAGVEFVARAVAAHFEQTQRAAITAFPTTACATIASGKKYITDRAFLHHGRDIAALAARFAIGTAAGLEIIARRAAVTLCIQKCALDRDVGDIAAGCAGLERIRRGTARVSSSCKNFQLLANPDDGIFQTGTSLHQRARFCEGEFILYSGSERIHIEADAAHHIPCVQRVGLRIEYAVACIDAFDLSVDVQISRRSSGDRIAEATLLCGELRGFQPGEIIREQDISVFAVDGIAIRIAEPSIRPEIAHDVTQHITRDLKICTLAKRHAGDVSILIPNDNLTGENLDECNAVIAQ